MLLHFDRERLIRCAANLAGAFSLLALPVMAEPQAANLSSECTEAYKLAAKGQYKEAIPAFSKAIAKNGNDAVALLGRGQCYLKTNDKAHALEDVTRVLQIDSKSLSALEVRSKIYFDQKDYSKALADCDEALKLDPQNSMVLANRGALYERLGKPALAKVDMQKAKQLMLVANLRGAALHGKEQSERALKIFEQNTKGAKLDYNSLLLQGDLLRGQQKYEEAIKSYNQALCVDKSAAPLYARAVCYLRLDDLNKCLDDLNQVIKLNPKQVGVGTVKETGVLQRQRSLTLRDVYILRAKVHSRLKQFDLALQDFDSANKTEPSAHTYIDRAAVLILKGDESRAIADFSTAIKIKPDPFTFLMRSLAYERTGQQAKANEDVSAAKSLDPDHVSQSDRLLSYAKMFNNIYEYNRSLEFCDKAVAANPKYTGSYLMRAETYALLGQNQKSLDDYGKAIALSPDEPTLYNRRAIVLQKVGKAEQAKQDLQKARSLTMAQASVTAPKGDPTVQPGTTPQQTTK
jgi:tetratricopeptide (TPR) repeat protein